MAERMLKVEEVALSVGVSVKTVNSWYKFKRENPENELVQLLPEFTQEHARATRYWKFEDLWKLIQFKSSVKHGRNGFMGSVTQAYLKKGSKHEKKLGSRE